MIIKLILYINFFGSPLKSGDDLRNALVRMYSVAAQYNSPPEYPVTKICGAIDGAYSAENDILSKIYAGVVAYYGNSSCQFDDGGLPFSLESIFGWLWQVGNSTYKLLQFNGFL